MQQYPTHVERALAVRWKCCAGGTPFTVAWAALSIVALVALHNCGVGGTQKGYQKC